MVAEGREHPFDALILLGDLIYEDGDARLTSSVVIEPFQDLFDSGAELIPVLGNRDYDSGEQLDILRQRDANSPGTSSGWGWFGWWSWTRTGSRTTRRRSGSDRLSPGPCRGALDRCQARSHSAPVWVAVLHALNQVALDHASGPTSTRYRPRLPPAATERLAVHEARPSWAAIAPSERPATMPARSPHARLGATGPRPGDSDMDGSRDHIG